MKKVVLVIGVLFCSTIGFSQKTATQIAYKSEKTALTPSNEERISKLEAEIASLKTAQMEMKKQFSELQSALPVNSKKKKLAVNRAGSKQITRSPTKNNDAK